MTLIIADVGSNFRADRTLALEYVSICREAGIDVVKYQTWTADTLFRSTIRHIERSGTTRLRSLTVASGDLRCGEEEGSSSVPQPHPVNISISSKNSQ
ncbi:MAG: hypothetical protein M0C28_32000 [Candidatus Moduliflexus flocculans]|nr:hypothetical protein [Candidatus Moduliflexus flocculans]